ncbi:MAG: insulinase family protein, partial [Clostridia bacterium]|nr:insulinase family protein [Clostridia bacterium]
MDTNKIIHGFRHIADRELKELKAVLRQFEHEKTGARLLWLDRDDENKTFAIAFRTLPEDDTGVFHILEHSVLCGSERYPTKEPFVELLKSSMQTFLNAFTFPDKTVYPVSSRNDQDFLNLMRVYLDAT